MRIPKRRVAPHGLPFSITQASCSSDIRKDSGLFCSINCCDDLKADAVPLFATFEWGSGFRRRSLSQRVFACGFFSA